MRCVVVHDLRHTLKHISSQPTDCTEQAETCHTLLPRFDALLPVLKIPVFPLVRTRQQHAPYFLITVVHSIKLLVMYSSLSCYLIPLKPKYSPRHPILKHVQPTFLPQCDQVSHPYNLFIFG